MVMEAGKLNRRVLIESPVTTPEATYGGQPGTWTTVATVWAEVIDVNPSSSNEAVVQGALQSSRRRVTVRMRWRAGMTSAMRLTVDGNPDRMLNIVAGPTEIGGYHEGLEFVAEELAS